MANPFFESDNWLLITDSPVLGKSLRDFKPANLEAKFTVWGILREGPLFDVISDVLDENLQKLIHNHKKIDDRQFSELELKLLSKKLNEKIQFYIKNRPTPEDGHSIDFFGEKIKIDLRNNARWDLPLKTMINLLDLLNQSKSDIYLNID